MLEFPLSSSQLSVRLRLAETAIMLIPTTNETTAAGIVLSPRMLPSAIRKAANAKKNTPNATAKYSHLPNVISPLEVVRTSVRYLCLLRGELIAWKSERRCDMNRSTSLSPEKHDSRLNKKDMEILIDSNGRNQSPSAKIVSPNSACRYRLWRI